MRTSKLKSALCVTLLCMAGVAFRGVYAADDTDAKKKEILEQIRKLEEKKADLNKPNSRPSSNRENVGEIVVRYENLLNCSCPATSRLIL